ncbi:MAG: AAA family ATPase, partial [Acidimicrobiales bacterium]
DGLVGLAPVKAEVRLVADLIQVQNLRRQRGLPVAGSGRHLVFTGNPGTGKTTVARLLAQIYRTLEVVEKGHLVETDRSQLVAGFVGHTAIQVRKVVEGALGGVLLVDEAYALARGDERDFGQEAIDTLVKLIEDHRDELVVIAAGYPDEMADFVDSNPGLRSRFPKTIAFPDYSDDELVAIFRSMATKAAYTCTPDVEDHLRAWFASQPRDKGFGNARLARNLFEAAVARQASRVVDLTDPTDEQLMALTVDDVGPPGPAR